MTTRSMAARICLAAAAAVVALTAAACGGRAAPDHGRVVAQLGIPFRPTGANGAQVVSVTVSHGQRFSIKVGTSDGPYWWTQSTRPDARFVAFAGNYDEGSCPTGLVGCRVPYFHTLVASGRGSTTMSWTYHDPNCQATPSTGTQGRACPPVPTVTIRITIR